MWYLKCFVIGTRTLQPDSAACKEKGSTVQRSGNLTIDLPAQSPIFTIKVCGGTQYG